MDIKEVKHKTSDEKIESKENIKLICVDNIDKICRTCLSETVDLRSCFDIISDNMCAANLIKDYTSLIVASDDFLPQNICNVCIAALLNSHTFKLNCINNERILIMKSDINKIKKKLLKPKNNLFDDDYISEEIVNSPDDIYVEELSHNSKVSQIDITSKSVTSINIKGNKRNLKRKITSQGKIKNPVQYNSKKDDEEFDQSELPKRHAKKVNKVCPICKKKIIGRRFDGHMRTHTKEKPNICEICSDSFSKISSLKRHMMTHTGERPHVCEYCGKGFIQATGLATHRRTHLRAATCATNYTCNYCERGFRNNFFYNAHLKIHISGTDGSAVTKTNKRQISNDIIRKYSCDQCKQSYRTKAILKLHQLTHGEKSFLCSHCGRGFFTITALNSHLMVHTGEKPHTCTVCKRKFGLIGNLVRHMSIHTGHKPYNCKICKKAFTQSPHLDQHMRTHSGERPYKCSFCEKAFALKGNLTVHVRTHTGETPYTCPVCNKGFYDSSNMKKHRRGHGEIENNSLNQITNPNL